ncbi:MAG: CoA pyrophosphatase [Bacteroidota bacterium]
MRIQRMQESSRKRENAKKAGVMALFYPNNKGLTHLLLIVRKAHPKDVHSGQIGFPGGQVEHRDTDLMYTALRETYEEVGVPIRDITVIRSLSQLYIPPSNFEVHPFIGLYRNGKGFRKQISEVETLVEVPFPQFMDDASVFNENLSTSYATDISVPAFKLNGYTVWGATAMMLSEIKELLKQVI